MKIQNLLNHLPHLRELETIQKREKLNTVYSVDKPSVGVVWSTIKRLNKEIICISEELIK